MMPIFAQELKSAIVVVHYVGPLGIYNQFLFITVEVVRVYS